MDRFKKRKKKKDANEPWEGLEVLAALIARPWRLHLRNQIAIASQPTPSRVPTSQPSSPTVSQSRLPSHKRNVATSIADSLHPLPRSRPTSEDPSPHPFLSSLSSPQRPPLRSLADVAIVPATVTNATAPAPLVASRCDCDSDLGFCVEIRCRIC
ncbi:hypothetical protein TIFTF001_011485 [Ficus carica]|uniref:Uncharacterized protein n=1 Tax=Ficus carica TaxID=3494 RepID=A0AA88ALV3_FICCA|nr:hypothetical protein TIFTF001_011485 [Ficus carica]